tara:strand:- start:2936 stop:4558 length:1623 start_codon:yes stop_codon:yes gene_type:complete
MVESSIAYMQNLQSSIEAVSDANDGLLRGFAQLGNENKKWTIFSRMISGSGLWRIQNKVRAVSEALNVFYEAQDAGVKNMMESAQSLAKINEEYNMLAKTVKKDSLLMMTDEFKSLKGALDKVMDPSEATNVALQQTKKMYKKTYADLGNVLEKQGKKIKAALPSAEDIQDDKIIEKNKKIIESLRKRTPGDLGEIKENVQYQSRLQSRLMMTSDPKVKAALEEQLKYVKEQRRELVKNVRKNGKLGRQANMQIIKAKFAKRFRSIWANTQKVGKMALTFLKIFIIAGIILISLKKLYDIFGKQVIERFKSTFNFIKDTLYPGFQAAFGFVASGFMDLMDAFTEGSFVKFFKGIIKILGGILLGLVMLVVTLGAAILGGLWAILTGMFDKFNEDVSEGLAVIKTIAMVISAIIIAIVGITAVILGAPVWIAVAIGTAIMAGVAAIISAIPGFADGGVSRGGLAIVGEKGAELVNLPRGSRVHSNQQSRQIAGGVTNNITVQVQGRIGASDQEIRDIAKKVGEHINREINRHTSSGVRRYG